MQFSRHVGRLCVCVYAEVGRQLLDAHACPSQGVQVYRRLALSRTLGCARFTHGPAQAAVRYMRTRGGALMAKARLNLEQGA